MKYQMVNEELKIASCSIADLTMEQVQCFLKQWHPGDSIGTLTLFYEHETGLLVLNRDRKGFDFYKVLAEKYLTVSETGRKKLIEKAPEGLEETFQVLDNCIRHRRTAGEIKKAEQNIIEPKDRVVLEEMQRRYSPVLSTLNAFCYGVMQGKRAERAKKKRGTAA